jgi:phosphoglucomutase
MTALQSIRGAAASGKLLQASAENIGAFLGAGLPAWAQDSIDELAAREAWGELNDRFFRHLEFGTGECGAGRSAPSRRRRKRAS